MYLKLYNLQMKALRIKILALTSKLVNVMVSKSRSKLNNFEILQYSSIYRM